MAIRPYRFTLPKVSGQEAQLLKALGEFLPLHVVREQIVTNIQQSLTKHVNADVALSFEGVAIREIDALSNELPQPCVVAVIGLPPHQGKILLQIDTHLAGLLIHRLLGSEADAHVELHPLTETEQGVLQYLLMQVLAEVHAACGTAERAHFRFERFCIRGEDVAAQASSRDACGVLTWSVRWGDAVGFVRVIFPRPFVNAAMLKPLPMPKDCHAAESAYLLERLQRFGWIRTTLWVEGGVAELNAEEMAGLEMGDVILFDQSALSLQGKQVAGEVIVHVGNAQDAGLRGEIIAGKRLGIRVIGIE